MHTQLNIDIDGQRYPTVPNPKKNALNHWLCEKRLNSKEKQLKQQQQKYKEMIIHINFYYNKQYTIEYWDHYQIEKKKMTFIILEYFTFSVRTCTYTIVHLFYSLLI